jgi:hypothetical protein
MTPLSSPSILSADIDLIRLIGSFGSLRGRHLVAEKFSQDQRPFDGTGSITDGCAGDIIGQNQRWRYLFGRRSRDFDLEK